MICLPLFWYEYATPFIAKLSASVPPETNIISTGSVPSASPITVLAFSIAIFADCPFEYIPDALPYSCL